MRQFLVTVIAGLTAIFIAAFFIPVILATLFAPSQPSMPSKMVLVLDLAQPVAEQPEQGFLPFAVAGGQVTLAELHGGLADAAKDLRVKGLFIRGGAGATSSARAGEIIEAMQAFQAAGKPVHAFAQDFGPAGLGDYEVLSQADKLWMQPTGSFLPAGLTLRQMFLKGTLEKIGVEPQMVQFREYKGAADIFTEDSMTDAQREANGRLLEVVWANMADAIADGRGVDRGALEQALETAPHPAEAALAQGLADEMAYEAQVREQLLAEAGDNADFVGLATYARRNGGVYDGDAGTIAVVYGEGPILNGEEEPAGPFGSNPNIGGDTMARAIDDAAADEDVKAILVRINSPGGSASASDQVLQAIKRAREAGKPVVASMGDVAASGGYYIPSGADLIIAQPSTITGSIGIVGGKFAISEMLNKLGVTVDAVATTENADIWAADEKFSPAQRARFTAWLADGYEDFKAKVAEGRGLSDAETEAVAKGRVWAGADALDNGLVDRLGGFGASVDAARELAGLEEGADVTLKRFPEPLTLREQLFGTGMNAEAAARGLAFLAALGEHPQVRAFMGHLAQTQDGGRRFEADVPEVR